MPEMNNNNNNPYTSSFGSANANNNANSNASKADKWGQLLDDVKPIIGLGPGAAITNPINPPKPNVEQPTSSFDKIKTVPTDAPKPSAFGGLPSANQSHIPKPSFIGQPQQAQFPQSAGGFGSNTQQSPAKQPEKPFGVKVPAAASSFGIGLGDQPKPGTCEPAGAPMSSSTAAPSSSFTTQSRPSAFEPKSEAKPFGLAASKPPSTDSIGKPSAVTASPAKPIPSPASTQSLSSTSTSNGVKPFSANFPDNKPAQNKTGNSFVGKSADKPAEKPLDKQFGQKQEKPFEQPAQSDISKPAKPVKLDEKDNKGKDVAVKEKPKKRAASDLEKPQATRHSSRVKSAPKLPVVSAPGGKAEKKAIEIEKSNKRKANLRLFNGTKQELNLDRLTADDLKALAAFLNLERGGEKSALTSRIEGFLSSPKDLGESKAAPTKKASSAKKSVKKATSAGKKAKKLSNAKRGSAAAKKFKSDEVVDEAANHDE